jgi:excisionase family DNA binding protein
MPPSTTAPPITTRIHGGRRQSTAIGRGLAPRRLYPRRPAMSATTGEWRPDPLLTIEDVAAWLGKPKNTLYAWHSRGKGPRAIRVGNTLRYRRSEVDRWLDEHTDQDR